MNDAHYHLLVNHLPIVGVLLGLLVLITGYFTKKIDVKMTALGIFVFSALAATAAFYTGDGAKEIVEKISGISETLIHTHEEFADKFFTVTLILGGLSLITFFLEFKKHKISKYGFIAVLFFGIASIILGKYVGTSGGEIRHTEIRKDFNTGKVELKQGSDNDKD